MSDAAEVIDVLHRHAEGMDTRDWAGFRSVFTDAIDIDYSSHRPGQAFRIGADDWVAHVQRRLGRLDRTQHFLSNARVTLTEDGARCSMYVRAEHLLHGSEGQRRYTMGGRYLDQLVRLDGGWRIASVTFESWWYSGDRSLLELPPDDGGAQPPSP